MSNGASRPVDPAFWTRKEILISGLALIGLATHLILRFATNVSGQTQIAPLLVTLIVGGAPLVIDLLRDLAHGKFGSDLLAGISIVTALVLGEYLAGTIVVLMLSGGTALEGYAVRSASSVLEALARRMPTVAHRSGETTADVPLDEVAVSDLLLVLPHEACPVDGTVVEGHGVMDESYLTGEPYLMSKTPGSRVLSGAINGETALTIRADRIAGDSRYARIMQVMQQSSQERPRLRRLGDQLGAWYTPLAVAIGLLAFAVSGSPQRFLAVMVVATPCPLLIAIPVAIIGSVSLAARCGIIIRDPALLERLVTCTTAIFDKTGTLTYGHPRLMEIVPGPDFRKDDVLSLTAGMERYSRHPLASAVTDAAQEAKVNIPNATQISEPPGAGLTGVIAGRTIQLTSRKLASALSEAVASALPAPAGGMECVVLIDGQFAALLRFRDEPRREGKQFIRHLGPKHGIQKIMLVSGDRESEVAWIAERVGIPKVAFSQSPEQKLAITRAETAAAPTVFVGDGINDAPALMAATVGVAFGQNSDVTSEAAGAVILDSSLERFDELLAISARMRRIALQSAVGGMAASVGGMILASTGLLPPVAGAITQEVIDVVAVLNALRAALPTGNLVDFAKAAGANPGPSEAG
jgi:heavy metal translocating P-type ATPase